MKVIGSSQLEIWEAPPAVEREICTRLTLRNPLYEEKQRHNGDLTGIPEAVEFFRKTEEGQIVVPRGAFEVVKTAAWRSGVQIKSVDDTLTLPEVDLELRGDLRMYQIPPAAKAAQRWSSVLEVPTGGGKTVIALWLAAQRRQRTLVTVPTVKLMEQWAERVETHLGVEAGLIAGGKFSPGAEITVGVIDSVHARLATVKFEYGHLIVDECHRAPGARTRAVIEAMPARYRLGLSATPWRRDGLGPAIQWLLGPTIKVEAESLVEVGAILPADIDQRVTGFETELSASDHYSCVMDEIVGSQLRNAQLVADIGEILFNREPGIVLALCDRRAHCRLLEAYLELQGVKSAVLVGGLSKGKTEAYDRQLREGQIKVIVATSQYLGEGWDFPAVGTLILAAPVKFSGKLIQQIGRALRPAPGMTSARIIDYVDSRVPVLLAAARARLGVYKEQIVTCQ